ncbi:hypothetical protein AVEN_219170-1 [Araneus ventricosus]|uniref:Uncharacterized protein n=1 Tax=Araneus ventricosus TaxID=182803 RepID=A0A4Y2FQG3_ARAVE|nr:hypothetical protein AVEN_219170-1 [Araneus ventricosus]
MVLMSAAEIMETPQGSQNTVADALSRIEVDSITKSPILNFKEFARAQKNDPDIQNSSRMIHPLSNWNSNPVKLLTAICFAIFQLDFHVRSSLLPFSNSYLITCITLRILG